MLLMLQMMSLVSAVWGVIAVDVAGDAVEGFLLLVVGGAVLLFFSVIVCVCR